MTRPGMTEPAESGAGEQDQAGNPMGEPLADGIVEGTRLAIGPPGDARHDLIDAAIARLVPRKRRLDRPTARWEVAIAGFLVGLATFAFLIGRSNELESVPVVLRALVAVVGGGLVAVYLWKRDRTRESRLGQTGSR